MKLKEFWRRVRRYVERQLDILFEDIAPEVPDAPEGPDTPPEEQQEAPAAPEPEPPPTPALDWRHGGFDGAGAQEDPACRISGLRMTPDGLSFKWDTGIPASWARHDSDNGLLVVAAAFYWDGAKWVGGKFEWIDENRHSRSFENIYQGYGGWDKAAFLAAKRRAFCVCAADGKRRSNLLEEGA